MNVSRNRLSSFIVKARPTEQCFSTSSPRLSRPRPVALPRSARKTQRALPSQAGPAKPKPGWPIGILTEAVSSGFLKVSAPTAIDVLNAIERLGSSSARQICTDYKVMPNDLTVLARILLRSGHEKTARDLVFASARLGDEEAILLVVKEAIKLDDLGSPRVALIYQQRFQPLLQKKHPAALYLEGQKLERDGQSRRALEIYEELVAADTTETFAVLGGISAAEIWKALGKLRARNKDRNGAEAAISTAALQYDDPGALFQLAKTFTSPSAPEYELYMLKAAASGEAKAAYELGLLYLKQSQGRISMACQASSTGPMPSTGATSDIQSHERKMKFAVEPVVATKKRRDAQEWFSVGAESDIIGSQLHLAILLRESGKLDDGLRWLTLAENPENRDSKEFQTWNPVISHVAHKWHDNDLNLADLDIDALRGGGLIRPRSDKGAL